MISSITSYCFHGCTALSVLNLPSTTMVTLTNSNALQNTPMQYSSYIGYFGGIYVPGNLVTTYQSATN